MNNTTSILYLLSTDSAVNRGRNLKRIRWESPARSAQVSQSKLQLCTCCNLLGKCHRVDAFSNRWVETRRFDIDSVLQIKFKKRDEFQKPSWRSTRPTDPIFPSYENKPCCKKSVWELSFILIIYLWFAGIWTVILLFSLTLFLKYFTFLLLAMTSGHCVVFNV